jgi:maleate cis-trans isomerase
MTQPTPRVDGWRLKIGRVAPTTVDYPNNLTRMIPDGVKMVATSSGAVSFNRAEMADARQRRREAATVLEEWGVDCILAAGGPVSTLEGADAEESFIKEVRAFLSVPFTTSMAAQVEALHETGAESLLAVTPFPENRDAETTAYLEAHGFDVVAIGGPNLPEPGNVRDLPRTASYQYAKRLADRTDEPFDTVYVACSPFGAAEHISRLEADVGCPVVMSAQAQLWWAFDAADIDPDMSPYGALFAATSHEKTA